MGMLDIVPTGCEKIENEGEIEEDKIFFQEPRSNSPDDMGIRVSEKQAKKRLKAVEGRDEDSRISACRLEIRADVETDKYYHASDRSNRNSIKENGLIPTHSPECPTDDGVYITSGFDEAVGWAETLGSERGFEEFDIYSVGVPSNITVLRDENPINRRAVPSSLVACTQSGIPPSEIDKVETVEVEPSEEKMGGF